MGEPNKLKTDYVIQHADQLITVRGFSQRPKLGEEMNDLGIIEDGAVALKGEKIVWVGASSELSQHVEMPGAEKEMNARGKTVLPGLIDTHNHLIFAGSKENEFLMRVIQGFSYLEITARGGGVIKSVLATRAASPEELFSLGIKRADRMLAGGITTSEAKSGYGLNLDDEIKMLKVIQSLDGRGPIHLVPTFLAHGIPPEFKEKSDQYVDQIIGEVIPEIGKNGLAKFCDVPFAPGRLFSAKQAERIFNKARDLGLKARVHADEFSPDGGAEFAAQIGAHSVDHCIYATDEGLKALKDQKVIANLLPLIPFNLLMEDYANARKMIETGVAVALGTDFNPSFYNPSLMLAITLACLKMKMTPAEAISAATINAAHSIGEAETIGSLEVGKQADIFIIDGPNYLFIPYSLGSVYVENIFKKGRLVRENALPH